MANAVRKTISLPAKLARDVQKQARLQGKSVSAIVQDALRDAQQARALAELESFQRFFGKKLKQKGIVTEAQLERFLTK
jgi:metal-responsive CopG/Arc/MetJ family transcriptional regulator